jgi:hypothetical protein
MHTCSMHPTHTAHRTSGHARCASRLDRRSCSTCLSSSGSCSACLSTSRCAPYVGPRAGLAPHVCPRARVALHVCPRAGVVRLAIHEQVPHMSVHEQVSPHVGQLVAVGRGQWTQHRLPLQNCRPCGTSGRGRSWLFSRIILVLYPEHHTEQHDSFHAGRTQPTGRWCTAPDKCKTQGWVPLNT